jgi:CelD/BcsL family acetyltransferase involved in cellulose biosynthesis
MSGAERAKQRFSGSRWVETAELERRRDEWRKVARECAMPTTYGDPGWLLPWWRTYGKEAEPWWFVLEREGVLRGVAALALTRERGMRTLRFAAEAWNGIDTPVCLANDERAFVDGLLDALAQRADEWDLWRIRRLPLGSLLARRLLGGDARLRASASDVRLQPYIPLPGDVEAFEARFGGKQRSTQRRKWRKLTDLGAEATLITDADAVEPKLRHLIELRRRRAIEQGQRHEHMDERFERFIVDTVRELGPEGARLWDLEADGETLAMRLNFVQGPREHSYLLGLSTLHPTLSPGSSLERHGIFAAIEEGRREFDLGPGRDEYKYRLGGVDRELTRVVVGSPSVRGLAAGALAGLDIRLRDSSAAAWLRQRRGATPERATPERPKVV